MSVTIHGASWILIVFFLIWLPWDLYRWLRGKRSFSQDMAAWGIRWPIIKLTYIVAAVYLFAHFFY